MKCGNGENFALTAKERRTKAPSPQPSTRPRTLTSPVPNNIPATTILALIRQTLFPTIQQRTSDQPECTLLNRLPIEIRRLIWQEVLGQKLLHIVRIEKRLLAIECPDYARLQRETRCKLCWGFSTRDLQLSPVPGYYMSPLPESAARPTGLLSLLKTCRLIYSEAIETLYTTNAFDLNHLDTLHALSTTIRPERLNLIQSLRLSWPIKYPMYALEPSLQSEDPSQAPPAPYDPATWAKTCKIIAGMRGLKTLYVHLQLSANGLGWNEYQFTQLLKPLKVIGPKEEFVVTCVGGLSVEDEGVPFRFTRVDD